MAAIAAHGTPLHNASSHILIILRQSHAEHFHAVNNTLYSTHTQLSALSSSTTPTYAFTIVGIMLVQETVDPYWQGASVKRPHMPIVLRCINSVLHLPECWSPACGSQGVMDVASCYSARTWRSTAEERALGSAALSGPPEATQAARLPTRKKPIIYPPTRPLH